MTVFVAALVIGLPFSPVGEVLGFHPLPVSFLAAIVVIVAAYLISAELIKAWFYRRTEKHGSYEK